MSPPVHNRRAGGYVLVVVGAADQEAGQVAEGEETEDEGGADPEGPVELRFGLDRLAQVHPLRVEGGQHPVEDFSLRDVEIIGPETDGQVARRRRLGRLPLRFRRVFFLEGFGVFHVQADDVVGLLSPRCRSCRCLRGRTCDYRWLIEG